MKSSINEKNRQIASIVRRSLRALAVVLPLAATGVVGVQARLAPANAVEYVSAEIQEQRIAAYIEPVRAVYSLNLGTNLEAPRSEVERVAGYWLEALRSGGLLRLIPMDLHDTTELGAKNEIMNAATALAYKLTKLAEDDANNAKYDEALRNSRDAIELASTLMASDLNALANSTALMREQYAFISQLSRHASEREKLLTVEKLISIEQRWVPISRMLRTQLFAGQSHEETEPLKFSVLRRITAILDSDSSDYIKRYEISKLMEHFGSEELLVANAAKNCWTRNVLRRNELAALLVELGYSQSLLAESSLPKITNG